MITRIAQTSRGEVVEIFLVGGEGYPRWLAALNDQVEASAREIGCVGMRAWGRAGWGKPLRNLGWKVETVAYEKNFPEGGRNGVSAPRDPNHNAGVVRDDYGSSIT